VVGRWPLSPGKLCVGRHVSVSCGAAGWSVLRANVTPSFHSSTPRLTQGKAAAGGIEDEARTRQCPAFKLAPWSWHTGGLCRVCGCGVGKEEGHE